MKKGTRLLCIGALSFEERCKNWVLQSLRSSNPPDSVVLFDYGQSATLGVQAKRLRDRHWAVISEAASQFGANCDRVRVNAYSMTDVEERTDDLRKSADSVQIDISCMTRPHVLALASLAARMPKSLYWQVAYTIPDSFGDLNSPKSRAGWKDTVWLSLGNRPILRNQGLSIGFIILGHEADRISIAFSEIEPASGICLICARQDRPDLHRFTYSQNRELLGYLKELRMPGPKGSIASDFFENGGWETREVDMSSVVSGTCGIARHITHAADQMDAPIVLVPFGPKIAVFAAAFVFSKLCPNRTWVIYPVAETHPIDYSFGVCKTEVFTKDQFTAGIDI